MMFFSNLLLEFSITCIILQQKKAIDLFFENEK